MSKKGKIYTINKDEFQNTIDNSNSIAEAITKLGYSKVGSAYKAFRTRARKEGIDLGPLKERAKVKATKCLIENNKDRKKDLDKIESRGGLKKRIIKEGLLNYQCAICNIDSWLNKSLSLHLDHINGDNTNNDLSNLRFLCPNCHSQTDTYCGKNKKLPAHSVCYCKCGNEKSRTSGICIKCENKRRLGKNTKIDWPKTSWIIKELETTNCRELSRRLGVSDVAIKKRIKNHS